MKEENCIFCKIANGEIPSATLYEDDEFRVILDVNPEKLQCDGFNIIQNNNELAGQTVFHFHVHLIPRYHNDNQNFVMMQNKMTPKQLDAVRDEIVGETVSQ